MINIVHRIFRSQAQHGNTLRVLGMVPAALLALAPAMISAMIPAAPANASDAAMRAAYRCAPGVLCELPPNARRPPGPPDRDARPFDGTLGRPCGYRWRYTPSGTRRVRVCF